MGKINLPPEIAQRVRGLQYQGVILTHGWFIIGPRTYATEQQFTLSNAVVVKRWGTERGVGPLIKGPADATELDVLPGDVVFEEHAVIYRFDCDVEAWCSITWPAALDPVLNELLESLRAEREQQTLLGTSPFEVPHALFEDMAFEATSERKAERA